MPETSEARHIPDENKRYLTCWLLIFTVTAVVAVIIVYNFSSILMLFNKGEIALNRYDKVIETVLDADSSFMNVSISGDSEYGQIYYETADKVAEFWVGGKANDIEYICGNFDSSAFVELSLMQKYKCIDTILRPLCRESDILTAEIALIKLSGRYAIYGFTAGLEWNMETENEKLTVKYHPIDEQFEFGIMLKPSEEN